MAKKTNEEKINEISRKLIQMFETGKMPEAVKRSMLELKKGDVPSKCWSLNNQIIMLANETTDARTFLQWKEVGRYPKKGSKCFHILAPIVKKIEKENDEGEVEELKILCGFKYIPVFRYEDTEGKPVEYPDYIPKKMPPLIEVARKFGLDIKYGPCISNYLGRYNFDKKEIMLCTHDVKTFFHELGHAAHERILKAKGKELKGGQDPDQEITAEFISQVLCQMYNIEGYEFHTFNYIKYYTGTDDKKEIVKRIMQTISDAEKALQLILDLADEKPWDQAA